MNTYLVIIEVLSLVYNGKNLNDTIHQYINNPEISKIRNISYGVLRNYFGIEYIINTLINKVDNKIRILLQIALFELRFSNKPEYAVVNDIVNLSYELLHKKSLKNFVNGVLRNYIRNKEIFLKDISQDYSLKFNLPNWFINKLKIQYRNNYLDILEALNYHPAMGLRINCRKINYYKYKELLSFSNIEINEIDNKIVLTKPLKIDDIPGFYEGLVSIQDIAAQYLYDILSRNKVNPKKVLDICAAPGGKTCQLLENFDCEILAIDIDKNRLEKINQNLNRLTLNANLINVDALTDNWWNGKKFDFILADVPCSATGTIKRNPDIKVNRTSEDILKFSQLQKDIVCNIWKMLDENGYFLYVTCSLLSEENQNNILWFQNKLDKFSVIEELQIQPSIYSDSLYYALICKK